MPAPTNAQQAPSPDDSGDAVFLSVTCSWSPSSASESGPATACSAWTIPCHGVHVVLPNAGALKVGDRTGGLRTGGQGEIESANHDDLRSPRGRLAAARLRGVCPNGARPRRRMGVLSSVARPLDPRRPDSMARGSPWVTRCPWADDGLRPLFLRPSVSPWALNQKRPHRQSVGARLAPSGGWLVPLVG